MAPPESKKRKRSSHTETIPPNAQDSEPPSRSIDFWYEDGNIVLQAENVQFRVHKSILAAQSPVFANTFAIPQPEQSEIPQVDDCSVVILQDTVKDIRNLMGLLYNTLEFYSSRKLKSLSVLGTMLRMGRKYEFKRLYKEAIHSLELEYPDDLDDWDSRKIRFPLRTIEVIGLAHEHSLVSILPAAYLDLCRGYTLGHIKEGFGEVRETYRFRLNEPLSCIMGYHELVKAISKTILSFLRKKEIPCAACTSQATCRASVLKIGHAIWDSGFNYTISFLSSPWSLNKPRITSGFCPNCVSHSKKRYETGREKVWDMLPKLFGVDSPDIDWEPESSDSESDTSDSESESE